MPLLATERVAANFTARELGLDRAEATVEVIANGRRTATWLQWARDYFGRRVFITSGFRPPAVNAAAGGSDTSDHLTGEAADFEVEGLSAFEVYQGLLRAQQERKVPPFDQLIFYVADNHVHVGVGQRMRGQVLLKTTEGTYVQLAGAFVSKIRGYL